MSSVFFQLPVVSNNARVKLNPADVSKLVTTKDYEYRYWPLKGNLYSNDLSDQLIPKANSVYSITPTYVHFENAAAGNGLATAFVPPSQSRFFVSGVFTVTEFPTTQLGMLLGNFNNPSGASQGFTFYVNGSSKNLTVLFSGSGVGVIALATLNKPIYVSAFVDKYNKRMDYMIVAEDQTFTGSRTVTTLAESGLPVSIGNTMQAQAGGGKYNCFDVVIDNINRYSDLTSYYNDAKARMNLKGIAI